jgi:hypothetical protein
MQPPDTDGHAFLPGRRRFLQAGLAGTVLLALLPHGTGRATSVAAAPFTVEHKQALAAIVPVMLAGALPSGAGHERAVRAVVDGVEVAVRALPLRLQAEVAQLFDLLTFVPARVLVARVPRAWSEADAHSIASFLDSWRTSWFALLRSAYQALHELIMASWYAQPQSWPALGYGGPARIG